MQKMTSYRIDNNTDVEHLGWWVLIIGVVLLLASFAIAIGVNQIGIFAILVIFGLLTLVSTLVNPDIGLFVFFLALYINLSSLLIKNYNFPYVAKSLVVLMFGIIFIRNLLFKARYQGWVLLTLLLVLYAFTGIISLIFAADYALAQSTLIEYIKDAMIGIIVVLLIQRPNSLRIAVWSILAAGIFMGSISVFQQFTGAYSNEFWGFATVGASSTGERLSGPIGDPNTYAQIMAMVPPLAIWGVWREKKLLMKGVAGWALFVTLMAVVFTFSRGGFLGLVSSFIILALLKPRRIPAAIIGFTTILFLFQFAPLDYQDRIASLLNILPSSSTGGYVDESVQGRTSENLVALNIFLDNPILGVGAGNYNFHYIEYSRKLGIDPRLQGRSAHNLYLEVAAERGLVGLLIFGSIIVLTLRRIMQSEEIFKRLGNNQLADLAIAIGMSLTTYLVSSIFLHDAYMRYFWLIVAVGWSVRRSAEHLILLQKTRGIPS